MIRGRERHRPPTQGPSRRAGAGLVLVVLGGLLAACGRASGPTREDTAPPAADARHEGETSVLAILAAIDAADVAAFAAHCADPADRTVAPLAAASVAPAVARLHEAYGQRARRVSFDLVVAQDSPIEVEATVDVEEGAASLVFTLRQAPDGAWRVVGWSEAVAPMRTEDDPPAPGGAPAAR